ncbi:hypothetical protein EPN96_05140 [bacterium]|nr:MAG: hypothetical protein EPN96_05140 [bacterium]
MTRRRVLLFLLPAFFIGAPVFAGTMSQDCLDNCHGEESLQSADAARSLFVDLQGFEKSVHGAAGLGCADCHHPEEPSVHPSGDKLKADCEECHEKQGAGYSSTVHASQEEGPYCSGCHTSHSVLPPQDSASTVNAGNLHLVCERCHEWGGSGDPGAAFTSWKLSGHPKGDLSEVYEEKRCLSCHQGAAAHGEENLTGQKCPECHLTGVEAENGEGFHFRTDEEASLLPFAMVILYRIVLFSAVFGALFLSGRGIFRRRAKKNG